MSYLKSLYEEIEGTEILPPKESSVEEGEKFVGQADEMMQRTYSLMVKMDDEKNHVRDKLFDLHRSGREGDAFEEKEKLIEDQYRYLEAKTQLLRKMFWTAVRAVTHVPCAALAVKNDWKIYTSKDDNQNAITLMVVGCSCGLD